MMLSDLQTPAISRTQQYKKVTKPLLERKRRARINRCLDELKELMVGALEAEGENISKLEKADILELTVRHLHRLQRPRDTVDDAQRYQAGFGQCAAEACQFLMSLPGIDTRVGHNLIKHLGACVTNNGPLSIQVPNLNRMSYSPPLSPLTPAIKPPTGQSLDNDKNSNNNNMQQEILSSTPSVQDLSKPLTGLLMQVPPIKPPAHRTVATTKNVLRNAILERRKVNELAPTPSSMPQQCFNGSKSQYEVSSLESSNSHRNVNEDDDEEIDIEKVEDDENMWRPW